MPLFTMDEPQPRLNPPIKNWREDMPENQEPQLVPPKLRWLTTLNDTFLEVPRYSTEVVWGGDVNMRDFHFHFYLWYWDIGFCFTNGTR